MYYVYQYLRTDLTPYYIGKGKNNRLSVKHRCKKPIDKNLIQIVANSLTESEAHLLERKLIAHYGRKDLCTGILRNLTSGGEGTTGYTHKEATKKKPPVITPAAKTPEQQAEINGIVRNILENTE
jgi:hypothetical protein